MSEGKIVVRQIPDDEIPGYKWGDQQITGVTTLRWPEVPLRDGDLFVEDDLGPRHYVPREWLPALARHPALIAEVVKNAAKVGVGEDGVGYFIFATEDDLELDIKRRYAIIELSEEAP